MKNSLLKKSKLINKSLALVVTNIDSLEENDVVVFKGTIIENQGLLYFSGKNKEIVQIDEYLNRINPIPNSLKEILLNSDYYISLSIGNIPDDISPDEYLFTGLKWPE